MVAKAVIRRKNPKWLDRLVVLYSGPRSDLAIGWPRGKTGGLRYPDGADVATVAATLNFGSASKNIPARPFMTVGGKRATGATTPIAEALVPAMNRGKITREGILEHMGPVAVGAFKEAILDGPWAPNAPRTVAEKGSAKPLVDTGLMSQSLTYVVRKHK